MVYSVMSFLIMDVLPIDVTFVSPLAGTDLLLCAIFGGVVSGIGSGLTIRFGGAIDGVDVLSVIFAKKLGLSLGTFVMIFNTILYIVCGVVTHSWILPLYSIVTYFVGSKTVDFVVEGIDSSKCAMIVTTKAEEISDALTENFQSSGTIVDAVGGYSKEKKEIIYFIINHFQINKLKSIVHEIDGSAFISLQDVSDIIRKALESPMFMIEKMNENMDKIGETAYKKAINAAKEVEPLFELSEKMLLAISYIFRKAEEVTPLALQKMLYFIQGIFNFLI